MFNPPCHRGGMKWGMIITLGALACGIGAFMPNGPMAPARDQSANSTIPVGFDPATADAQGSAPDYLSGEMVLQQRQDGHFYASPTVNSVPIEALVDTGASVIALTGADAEAIGLNWDQSDIGIIGRGANGPIQGVQVRLDTVQLGNFEVHDVDAMIIPEGLHVTLLGQSFLSRIPNVEIANGQMNLSEY
ncbi:retropepsin-like aspartic protease family protein [Croceicoccus ponticola]|nr:TIGR02281 family clan AA aspartic protease [Croceicoccus ponticola]